MIIFLEEQKDKNYASLYTSMFSKENLISFVT
jgi:hypothetical protein